MNSKNRIQVKSSLTELNQLLSWFDQLSQSTISSTVWVQCKTALAEGFTNAVRHAHKNKPADTPIDIEVTVQNESLEIRIWDYGGVFDLVQKLEANARKIDRTSIGGRGLVLLDRISDHLSYDRTTNAQNCLLIIKNYSLTP